MPVWYNSPHLILDAHGWRACRGVAATGMNWADWTIVAVVGVSCAISLWRGFVKEALSLLAWVAAAFVAIAFHPRLAVLLSYWIETPSIRIVLAFLALFVATLLVGSVLNVLLVTAIRASGLGLFDRLLGVGFGVARGLVVVLALVVCLPMLLPVNQDGWWRQSRLIPHFELMDGWSRTVFGQMLDGGSSLLNLYRPEAVQSIPVSEHHEV